MHGAALNGDVPIEDRNFLFIQVTLTPPNGAPLLSLKYWLIQTLPASSRSAVFMALAGVADHDLQRL